MQVLVKIPVLRLEPEPRHRVWSFLALRDVTFSTSELKLLVQPTSAFGSLLDTTCGHWQFRGPLRTSMSPQWGHNGSSIFPQPPAPHASYRLRRIWSPLAWIHQLGYDLQRKAEAQYSLEGNGKEIKRESMGPQCFSLELSARLSHRGQYLLLYGSQHTTWHFSVQYLHNQNIFALRWGFTFFETSNKHRRPIQRKV